jgi:uncharacterized OsmC-like protein
VREHFSPTDIFATALAESVFASLVVLGKDRNIDITGATCELKKQCILNQEELERFSVFLSFSLLFIGGKRIFRNAVKIVLFI